MNIPRLLCGSIAAISLVTVSEVAAGLTDGMTEGAVTLKSAGPLAFAPEGILFVGDTKAASVVAIATGDSKSCEKKPLKVEGIGEKIASVLGTTADQIAAKQIGQETVFPSLELATEDFTGYIGGCDPAYSCAYMNTITWRDPKTPLPMEINPRIVFERMFGRPGTSAQRLERMAKDRSILDSVMEDVADLAGSLGPRDRNRLDAYLENVREIERRIQRAEKQATTEVRVPDAPIGIPESFEEHAMFQFDLISLAYEADITRVFTFMISRDASQRVYPNIGLTEPHHSMSHHGGDETKIANLVKLNTYHISLFAKFLEKLRSTPDGDGSLLDHALILWGSGMSESNTHSRLDIPTLLVGGGAGLVKGNRHLQAPQATPFANLMLDLSGKFGLEAEKYGTLSTGRLEV